MKNKIIKCLVALGVALGLMAGGIGVASATPNPPYGQWLDLSNQWSPQAPSNERCWLTFSQGVTSGHPYAKIKRTGLTSTCYPYGAFAKDCYLQNPASYPQLYDGLCFVTLEIVYQTGPTSYGTARVNLSTNSNDQSWYQVTAPVVATFVDARIYSNAFAQSYPTIDPFAYDGNATYGGGITLTAWFASS